MRRFILTSFKQSGALAEAVANAWLAETVRLRETVAPYCVALSGGRIARKLFAAFSQQAQARAASLRHVHFFWADERCVPSDDAESNYRIARELLFNPLRIATGQIHRVRSELEPEVAAREAGAELRWVAPKTRGGQPIFDLVLLGMGEDGHVASLFPGEPISEMANPAVYRVVTAPKPLPHRVTLGYGAIAAAREVWVLITGAGKRGALQESLQPGGRTPLARVLSQRTRTRIFTDVELPPADSPT